MGAVQHLQGGGKLTKEVMGELIKTSIGLSNSASTAAKEAGTLYMDSYQGSIPKDFKDLVLKRLPKQISTLPKPAMAQKAPVKALDILYQDYEANKVYFEKRFGYLPSPVRGDY